MGLKMVQTNFSAGELDPLLDSRTDIAAYTNGARRLRNVALLNQGGVARRPGLWYLHALAGRSRLMPFEFADDERYLFAFQSGKLEIFSLAGNLIQTLTGCPWNATTMWVMTVTQAADVMVIAHRGFPIQKIVRTSATTFVRKAFTFAFVGKAHYQPYFKFAEREVTLSCSGTTGSVTVTASDPYFQPGHVGTRLRWYDTELLITAYTGPLTVTATAAKKLQAELPLDPFKAEKASAVVEVQMAFHGLSDGQSITISGSEVFGGFTDAQINKAHVVDVIGRHKFQITLAAPATSSVVGGGPAVKYSGNNIASRVWDEQVFSDLRGYPGAVCFHEDRLWFAGAFSIPNGLWGSVTGDHTNFDVGEGLETDSIQVIIGGNYISNIRHIVSNRDLQIFTSTAEFFIPKPQNGAVTPLNITVARQTPFGCATVAPVQFEGATIFMQGTKKTVREFLYIDMEQAYQSGSITFLSEHLIVDPIDMAVTYGSTKRGEQYLMLVNEDGTLPVFHSARAEKLAGWTLWDTVHPEGAMFCSVCQIGNVMYVSVCWDNETEHHLMKFAEEDTELTLDAALKYTSSVALTDWVVDPIYRGHNVSVITGKGIWYKDVAVDATGHLTIPLEAEAKEITVGWSYDIEIETLPIHLVVQDGDYSGRPKRIARVIINLNNTLSVAIQGNRLWIKQVTDDFSLKSVPVSGQREFFLLGWQRDATLIINQEEPLPLRVIGLAMEVQG